jgi:hypothetical protein
MDEHHADKSSVCLFQVSPVYVEFTEWLCWDSVWRRPRYLAFDLGLGALLTLCCLRSLELDSYRVGTDMVEAHRSWVTHAEVPQSGIAF